MLKRFVTLASLVHTLSSATVRLPGQTTGMMIDRTTITVRASRNADDARERTLSVSPPL